MNTHPNPRSRRAFLGLVGASLTFAACGGGSGGSNEEETRTASSESAAETGVNESSSVEDPRGLRLVSAEDGAAIQDDPPEDLVILDVRTPEEFAEGHLEGALLVDFYDSDFRSQLAELNPDVPYLLYCNSGNRSGQTVPILEELGFSDVADIDGGIQAWYQASLPTVTP